MTYRFGALIGCMLTVSTAVYADQRTEKLYEEVSANFVEQKALISQTLSQKKGEIELERQGAGWRYVALKKPTHDRIIIFSHGHKGRAKNYKRYAKGGKKFDRRDARDPIVKAKWFEAHGVSFLTPLRKTVLEDEGVTQPYHGVTQSDYGYAVEAIEVFFHFYKQLNFGNDEALKLCHVGFSEGGSAAIFTSLYYPNLTHVAVSPAPGKYSAFWRFGQVEFFHDLSYQNQAHNLTVLIGGAETKKISRFLPVKQNGIEVIEVADYQHGDMSDVRNIETLGPLILRSCGFEGVR